MPDSADFEEAPRNANFLWVDLTHDARTALVELLDGRLAIDLRRVNHSGQIPGAIKAYVPLFVYFEFDELEAPGINALARIRHEHPSLPVVLITGCFSEAVARWALQMRVWDMLVKPMSAQALRLHLATMTKLKQQHALPNGAMGAMKRQNRTLPAITHVAAQFHHKIALESVAALCGLSLSQFCRVFRQEQGVSFAQFLLHYRIERACKGLACPGALAKEVAYSVGFNDLSYFTWAFKRQVGVCPSRYRPNHCEPPVEARLS
jgi:AraC-like DNA-binding protein